MLQFAKPSTKIAWVFSIQVQQMLVAKLVLFVLLEVQITFKEEWKSVMTISGGQSVIAPGPSAMPELSAGNLDSHQLVSVAMCS